MRKQSMKPIYLDHNATTPVDPEVAEAMYPFINEHFGNPSSNHWYGKQAKKAVEKARQRVADLLACSPSEIVFTGGGSESNNHVLKEVFYSLGKAGDHLITSRIEHPAIINPCRFLEKQGYQVSYLPVDQFGMVNPLDVQRAVKKETILISIMHANNEVGTIQEIERIGEIAKESDILFHTDAAQSVGKIPTIVDKLKVDFLSIAGHKLYAPKGVGALFIRDGIKIEPLIHGAGHENGRRAGTENVIHIVGLGKACEVAAREMSSYGKRVLALRERLHQGILGRVKNVRLNGHATRRLPNTLNISFRSLDSHKLLAEIPEIAASTGSACHADVKELSQVLQAMGLKDDWGFGAIRLSLGKNNTPQEVDRAVDLIVNKVNSMQ
jgi:cysteine desulfurase